jgi:hypothetical protein
MLIIGIRTERLQVEVSFNSTRSADATKSKTLDSAAF